MFEEFTGLEYLKMDIACKHDKAFEKENWTDRLEYFKTLDFNAPKFFTKSSNPIGLRAAVQAYKDTLEGKPTGYQISLDACSSGLQILSMLVSCNKSFQLCGGNSVDCVDSYTEIYQSMNLLGTITRKECKSAIMTSLYGSVATPKGVFKENVELFYSTMEDVVPGAWNLNLAIQELWNIIPGNTYSWTLPDNFHAHIETNKRDYKSFTLNGEEYQVPYNTDKRPDFHKGLGPNLIHSIDGMVVREMFRRCMFNKTKITNIISNINSKETDGNNADIVRILWNHYLKTNYLSVRILDYLDESTMGIVDSLLIAKLIITLPDEPFELVSVHDCFRSHANYGNDVRKQYNLIMADINNSNMLQKMAREVTKSNINLNKVGTIDRNSIVESNYMIA